jgi:hypothetical protein
MNRRTSRRWWLLPIVALLALAGCADPPSGHEERLEKAAGLTAFRITCHEHLWNRTGVEAWGGDEAVGGKITKRPLSVITVELSGPQLVDLLEKLAHFGWGVGEPYGSTHNTPEARRMYRAIAPVIDRIKQIPRAGDPVPEVVVDDMVKPTSTPTPSWTPPTPAPTRPSATTSR